MPLSTIELAQAREITAQMLDELGPEAYLFQVEPREGPWEVKIECAIDDGWETVIVPVSKEQLLACREQPEVRARLLAEWRARLKACKSRSTSPTP